MGVVYNDLEAGAETVVEGDGKGEHGQAAERGGRGEREESGALRKRAFGFRQRGAVHGG